MPDVSDIGARSGQELGGASPPATVVSHSAVMEAARTPPPLSKGAANWALLRPPDSKVPGLARPRGPQGGRGSSMQQLPSWE
jgi:hypothetical protein